MPHDVFNYVQIGTIYHGIKCLNSGNKNEQKRVSVRIGVKGSWTDVLIRQSFSFV